MNPTFLPRWLPLLAPAVLGGALLGGGCGGDETSDESAATVALAACTSSDAGARRAACDTYAEAFCAFQARCTRPAPEEDVCRALAVAACEGRTHVEEQGFLACLDEVTAAAEEPGCNRVLWGGARRGACAGLGQREDGASCSADGECASGWCVGEGAGCGTCQATPAVGDSCNANEGCGELLECRSAQCAAPGVRAGDPCASYDFCDDGSLCLGGVCTAVGYVGEGEACNEATLCDPGGALQCIDGSCKAITKARAVAGEPCGDTFGGNDRGTVTLLSRRCDSGLVCDTTIGVFGECVEGVVPGADCSSDADCAPSAPDLCLEDEPCLPLVCADGRCVAEATCSGCAG